MKVTFAYKLWISAFCSFFVATMTSAKEPEGKTSLSGLAAEEKSVTASDGTVRKSGPIEVHDYGWEITSSLSYQQDTGNIQKSGEDKVEKMTDKNMEGDLRLGRLQGDNFEPIFNLNYKKTDRQIGSWKSTQSMMGWGIGAIFNIPISPYQRDENFWKYNAPLFGSATWIPYGGFILESKNFSYDAGDTLKTTLKAAEMRSKLIFGTRYMLFTHVAVNMWVSLAYDNTKDEVTEKSASGGTLGRVVLEAKLFSFSVLF
jgi:hypothetical protein